MKLIPSWYKYQTVRQINVSQENMNNILLNQTIYQQLFDFIKLTNQKDNSIPIPLTEKGGKLLNEALADRLFWKKNLSGLIQRFQQVNAQGKRVIDFIKEKYE